MTDNEITREKTFSEELPYFKERIKEIFDNYDNPDGYADVLYLSALSDSNRIVRKAEEEINRQQAENERLQKEIDSYDVFYFCSYSGCESASTDCWKTCPNSIYNKTRTEASKEFAWKLKDSFFDNGYESPDVDFDYFVDKLAKEMVGDDNA